MNNNKQELIKGKMKFQLISLYLDQFNIMKGLISYLINYQRKH